MLRLRSRLNFHRKRGSRRRLSSLWCLQENAHLECWTSAGWCLSITSSYLWSISLCLLPWSCSWVFWLLCRSSTSCFFEVQHNPRDESSKLNQAQQTLFRPLHVHVLLAWECLHWSVAASHECLVQVHRRGDYGFSGSISAPIAAWYMSGLQLIHNILFYLCWGRSKRTRRTPGCIYRWVGSRHPQNLGHPQQKQLQGGYHEAYDGEQVYSHSPLPSPRWGSRAWWHTILRAAI